RLRPDRPGCVHCLRGHHRHDGRLCLRNPYKNQRHYQTGAASSGCRTCFILMRGGRGVLPYVTILGRTLPSYGMLGMGALLLGLLIALVRCPRFGLSRDDCAYLYILGAIGALVGAKVLYLLPRISELAADFHLLWEQPEVFA